MRAFRNIPIRRKLTAIIMLTSSIALLVACAAFVAYDQVSMRTAMTRNLSAVAQMIGTNSTAALAFGDQASAEEILASLRAKPGGGGLHLLTGAYALCGVRSRGLGR